MTMPVNSEIRLLGRNNPGTLFTYVSTVFRLIVLVAFGGALLFGIFQSIKIASLNGFIDGMMFGVVLAATTVPILTILDVIQRIRCYLKYKVVDFEIKQERRFLLDSDYGFVFDKLYEVLLSNKKLEIHRKDKEDGAIEGISKSSWKSFGEIIKVMLSKSSQGTVVVVSSKPRIPITMIDYCKNFENIENIMKDIKDVF